MNLILGTANRLQERVSDESISEDLRTIAGEANRLARLGELAQDLHGTITEAGDLGGPCELVGILEAVRETLRQEYPRADINLTAPSEVWTTAGPTVELAFREAIENGIEHTDAPKPEVDIEVWVADSLSGPVVVTIADNGPGIPDHERTVLEQGDESPLEHSSGLGLWVIKWIINHKGGTIDITNGETGESVVTLTLPAMADSGAEQPTPDQSKHAPGID